MTAMEIRQTLQLKLSQRLILTPSLQLAIKLLPMTTLELVDMLNQEVVENPLLEEVQTEELKDVANDIGMHESTVSRVVNNKYMHTPNDVFEMK